MDKKVFVNLVIQSLEAITKPYRAPYKGFLYERILCYEFYHQFRLRMGYSSVVLHGELEKGYRKIDDIPDFVFHVPGSDEDNFVAMEFKSTNNSMTKICKDLNKLLHFRSYPLFYQTGVFVLFGPEDKLIRKFNRLSNLLEERTVDLLLIAYDVDSGKVVRVRHL